MTIRFKELLLQSAGLLSLSQSDCDLFFIAQANSITYSQLALTGLHGTTTASGRLSIKHLEQEGYVQSRLLPGTSREKYYILSTKGKKRVEKLFRGDFLAGLAIDLDRRPPASAQQLPHRIHTGDLYFCYLANPFLAELPAWHVEAPYQEREGSSPAPRCDAMLDTSRGTYYIEQDNSTQGDGALSAKIRQYMDSGRFMGKALVKNGLIFSINCVPRERNTSKPPFSVYRILLKAQRVWACLENETGTKLSFQTFCAQFETSGSPSLAHLSSPDKKILQRLAFRHPDLSLEELETLKKNYLYDPSLADERTMEMDDLFTKRLRQRFYPFLANEDHVTLKHRLRMGLRLFVMPNHRLKDFLPFALQGEYRFPSFLDRLLFFMGISEMELWHYHDSYQLKQQERTYFFRNAYTNGTTEHLIIAEDIAHDLGGRERVRYFLSGNASPAPVLFILFVFSREDAVFFLAEHGKLLHERHNRNISLCFLDKSEELFYDPARQNAYYKSDSLWLPAQLDFDRYLGELRLTERQV